ncbi:MAG: DUF169 domain-containing protein [Candidatus Aminicenantes bacterium]|nr:MAG: DUF169 domain-containing protein [Candidatus Aminicenantes bacterium]
MMLPKPERLIEKLELTIPLMGLYDAPDAQPFEPVVEPEPGKNICIFDFYKNWLEGKTLHVTRENSGCGGCAYWIFGKHTREREDFVKFLAETEGLKDTKALMNRWLDILKPYKPQYPHVLIGPLREDHEEYLKSITFFVNPDQLSSLMIGAQYYHAPNDPLPPVIAPFGSGCMQLLPLFKDYDYPQAIIGTTDIAMRRFIPPGILAFTVTLPLYRQLCQLDERSFLYKPFLDNLKEARGEKGIGRVC